MIIKEIFETMQGEGSKSGMPAVFVRLAGCNLWSGKQEGRIKGKGHCALWCDTEFVSGDKIGSEKLEEILELRTHGWTKKMVVFTGGEPCLQLKRESIMINDLLNKQWIVAVETNGTISAEKCHALNILHHHPLGHITVSPKPLMENDGSVSHIALRFGTDLKVIMPTSFNLWKFRKWNFKNFYLQPMDEQNGNIGNENVSLCLEEAKKYGYSISIQTHKFIGLK